LLSSHSLCFRAIPLLLFLLSTRFEASWPVRVFFCFRHVMR
jgi:hypothetical protein